MPVLAEQARENHERLQVITRQSEISPDQLPKDTIYPEFSNTLPAQDWDDIHLASGFPSFVVAYRKALEDGISAIFLTENLPGNDYGRIYRAVGDPELLITESDKRVATQYTSEFTGEVRSGLEALAEKIEASDQPDIYKAEYLKSITRKHLPLIEMSRQLANPEFTRLQKTPEEWAEFIDVESSAREGEVVLRHEGLARQTLELSKAKRESENKAPVKSKDALSFWNLSESEAEYLGIDEIGGDDLDLSPEKGAKLFEVLLKRLGGDPNWKVVLDESTSFVTVQSKSRQIKYPAKRRLREMEAVWIPAHELVHVARGMNGRMQGLTLQAEGVYDYNTTEEGTGAVAEMVAGQEFGDERQAKMAARYLGSAMMLKAKVVDGQIVASYTPQEVYDELTKKYGVNPTDATEIIWRNQRGTSLKHQGLVLDVATDEGAKQLPIAECFTRDCIYFEGQMAVFNWMKSLMPVVEGQKDEVTLGSLDFSGEILVNIGYAQKRLENPDIELPLFEMERDYQNLAALGRKKLLEFIEILSRGKIRLDSLTTDSKRWEGYMANKGLVEYSRIYSQAA